MITLVFTQYIVRSDENSLFIFTEHTLRVLSDTLSSENYIFHIHFPLNKFCFHYFYTLCKRTRTMKCTGFFSFNEVWNTLPTLFCIPHFDSISKTASLFYEHKIRTFSIKFTQKNSEFKKKFLIHFLWSKSSDITENTVSK